MVKPILFTNWRSACAWRVRIALNLKGIEYEERPVNLQTKEGPNAAECFRLNPARRVPFLVHGDVAIGESLAIIEYIDETFPGPPLLLPKDPVKRATARAIALHVASGIQPLHAQRVLVKVAGERGAGADVAWAAHWIRVGCTELEAMLSKSAGVYSVGDDVSVADLVLPSLLFNARRYAVPLDGFPVLLRLEAQLGQLAAFVDACPERQSDAPKGSC